VTTAAAPQPSYRLIPSRFPPVGLFDTVATAADAAAVMELAGWTNDRLVAERVARLPRDQWVYGRANSSIIMASFLHVAPGGMRFNGPDLGAWYAAASLTTAVVEVVHHLRREAHARGEARLTRMFRTYTATLGGDYVDVRNGRADLHDPLSYAAGQAYGEALRARGGTGILYRSVRHAGGQNAVCFRPSAVTAVMQADHYEIRVEAAQPRIEARRVGAVPRAV
jgi:hypothetical protein